MKSNIVGTKNKIVRGMDSSSQVGLIMAPGQETNSDKLDKPFWFSIQ